jgi:DNA-binding HxlR family transcriptional regulator
MTARVPFHAALQDAALTVLGSLPAARPETAARRMSGSSPLSAPLATALDRLHSRRRLLLAWHLFWGPRAFAELQQLSAGIPKRTLRQELLALEADGLVERRPSSGDEGHAEYTLTPLGEALKPALASLYLWGLHVQESSAKPRSPTSGSGRAQGLLRSADSG